MELREKSFILIVAVTDTSAVAFGVFLLLLAKYPDVRERVYRERRVNRIVGVETLAVATGRHAILGYIYVIKMYTVVNGTIEPSEKGVAQSFAHGDASPLRTHFYILINMIVFLINN
ncbi:hypothetical protein EVAR_54205_1 [Eumeta japonica]|uniref:Uncharacterized protein n=1 Tax=Eumeta variegata TaxID=151549 RepID=A0A4C1YCT0_EUMVA|nr:hypothetical protein EVAR_54205_1 [Eumeta japonica]